MADTAAQKAAKAEAQAQRDPATVETKPEADAADDARAGTDTPAYPEGGDTEAKSGDGGDGRKAAREHRARQFNGNVIQPGVADEVEVDTDSDLDPLQEEGPVTLDTYVDGPSSASPSAPGPYDTVDPLEHASSVLSDKGSAAMAGYGTVNAVVPIPDPSGRDRAQAAEFAARDAGQRTEEYEVAGPNGVPVKMWHNLDTGETKRLSSV